MPRLQQRSLAAPLWWIVVLRTVATATVAVAIMTVQPTAAYPHGDGLRVLDAAWTDVVIDRACGQRYVEVAPRGSLVLWTRIAGSAGDIDALRRDRRLPIYHKWFHRADGSNQPEDAETFQAPALEVPLDVGTVATVDPLQTEVAMRGFFDWRTWSVKHHVPRGKWIVKVVDALNDPLRCGDGDCKYEIRVP
jgi:hypothetical protein